MSVTADLTPNSFLVVKDCKLTGGFAAKFWFGANPHAGDFVITLGGYNPAFKAPSHYPVVPRLGLSWPILEGAVTLSIKGGTYFALTPAGIMAGAAMQALFAAGPLRAWFNASADFLIAWQPFYFRAEVDISVGVALTLEIAGVKATLSAELGAGLSLWGPEFAGLARVNWRAGTRQLVCRVVHDPDRQPECRPRRLGAADLGRVRITSAADPGPGTRFRPRAGARRPGPGRSGPGDRPDRADDPDRIGPA
jgi:hypothetical protein